jgi:carnitine 3-dehydrogenase
MIRVSDGMVMATCDQLMLHVSLETRRTCDPPDEVAWKVADLAALHGGLT